MNQNARPRVVFLAGRGESSNIVYHSLTEVADVVAVVQEDSPSRLRMLERRVRRLGLFRVVDQVLFIAFMVPFLQFTSAGRTRALLARYGMNASKIPPQVIHHVSSINHSRVAELLRLHDPDVVVVNGTRIIGKMVLESADVPFVNTHVGITPAYRGVHGGYWALADGKPELAGVTVHRVDKGIDTGAIIAQALIYPEPEDNFYTYPTLQLAAGLPLLKAAVVDIQQGRSKPCEPLSKSSRLYYHPGLTEYLRYRVTKGVR
jgi:folate-dependent phosphoribosylglycinamide formyltransferase PurN